MTNSLVIFTKAALMLAQADTIQKAKELKTLALTAADWAKRKNMGEEAIQHCRSYALEAERKMGQMLLETQRNDGGRPANGKPVLAHDKFPTLPELGITRNESAEAQLLAQLKPEDFEKIKTGKKTKTKAKKEYKDRIDHERMESEARKITTDKEKSLLKVCDVRHCSCAELFESGINPDAVITDPPYPQEFLPVFSELSSACKNVPLVAVMVGQTHLPAVLERLCDHLKYRWTLAYLTPGAALRQWQAKMDCAWKPVLLFGEASEFVYDVFKSDASDKLHHDWGQSESGMADLVSRLTKPGQLVCDPFVGGGATAVAALSLNRRFVGCDIDKQSVNETMTRIKAMP